MQSGFNLFHDYYEKKLNNLNDMLFLMEYTENIKYECKLRRR